MNRIIPLLLLSFICTHSFGQVMDDSFGLDGVATIETPEGHTEFVPSALINGANSQILVVGRLDAKAFLMEFNEDGSLNDDFGNEGWVLVESQDEGMRYVDLHADENGLIYCLGGIDSGTDEPEKNIFVDRFLPSGEADLSFGTNGRVVFELPSEQGPLEWELVEGAMLIAANQTVNTDEEEIRTGLILKMDFEGELDSSFGIDGISEILPVDDHLCYDPLDLAVAPTGIYVSGSTCWQPEPGFGWRGAICARLNFNGSIDATFSDDGYFIGPQPAGGYSYTYEKCLPLMDGGVVIYGARTELSAPDLYRKRLDDAGNDVSESPDLFGIVPYDFLYSPIQAIDLNDGTHMIQTQYNFFEGSTYNRRYEINGAIVPSFGVFELPILTDVGISSNDLIKDVEGRIVNLGVFQFDEIRSLFLTRYFPNIQLSVNGILEDEGFTVYPNPAVSTWTIECDCQVSEISLYNALGEEVLNELLTGGKLEIDASRFPSGMYIANAQTDSGTAILRLVKN